MENFKLVLMDYAKVHLEKPLVQKLLSDLIITKQKNFERTDPNYVVVDKHDMIGTHALIFETSNPYEPRMVLALRVTYQERAEQHHLLTPMQELVPKLDSRCQKLFADFQKGRAKLVDCNSWFVDPEYSLKNSGLRLSDIAYVMVYLQITRMGYDHFVGCSNEKFKAHRWVENIGYFQKDFTFVHPVVPDIHMLVLLENFNLDYLKSVYEAHRSLFDQMLDVSPENSGYKSLPETISSSFKEKSKVLSVQFSAGKKAG